MIQTDKRMRLCRWLLVMNLAVIWGNSLFPGEISGQISSWAGRMIGLIFNLPFDAAGSGHGLLRKAAHFTEFACLGGLLCWHLRMLGEKGRHLAGMTMLGVMLAACADETIQTLIPNRGPSVIDVWIDTFGGFAGMALLLGGHHFRKRKQKQFDFLEETI
jgi:VanZ family protein